MTVFWQISPRASLRFPNSESAQNSKNFFRTGCLMSRPFGKAKGVVLEEKEKKVSLLSPPLSWRLVLEREKGHCLSLKTGNKGSKSIFFSKNNDSFAIFGTQENGKPRHITWFPSHIISPTEKGSNFPLSDSLRDSPRHSWISKFSAWREKNIPN